METSLAPGSSQLRQGRPHPGFSPGLGQVDFQYRFYSDIETHRPRFGGLPCHSRTRLFLEPNSDVAKGKSWLAEFETYDLCNGAFEFV